MEEPRDPMSLPNSVLELLASHEAAARHAGLHPHTMRRQIETAVEAYRRAVASGDAAAIAEAEDDAIRRAAEAMAQLAQAAVRLLEEERRRQPTR